MESPGIDPSPFRLKRRNCSTYQILDLHFPWRPFRDQPKVYKARAKFDSQLRSNCNIVELRKVQEFPRFAPAETDLLALEWRRKPIFFASTADEDKMRFFPNKPSYLFEFLPWKKRKKNFKNQINFNSKPDHLCFAIAQNVSSIRCSNYYNSASQQNATSPKLKRKNFQITIKFALNFFHFHFL